MCQSVCLGVECDHFYILFVWCVCVCGELQGVYSPFWGIGSGVGTGPHQGLDGVEEVSLCDVAHAALIYKKQLHQLHGERHGHVVQPILHRLRHTKQTCT